MRKRGKEVKLINLETVYRTVEEKWKSPKPKTKLMKKKP